MRVGSRNLRIWLDPHILKCLTDDLKPDPISIGVRGLFSLCSHQSLALTKVKSASAQSFGSKKVSWRIARTPYVASRVNISAIPFCSDVFMLVLSILVPNGVKAFPNSW
ncbi:hypothetical protein AVEN_77847-1 [Araneus ventricosus]|uniref:Uncharacterized protein n=1 Tax=Araneus ventricosus TaxID=182803 RepID=A0A4Y2GQ76_ARAVE|nr:hypothetical protein AVEN_77847-1 [Araneus ventricosus]